MTDEASTASPGDLSDKPQSSKHKVDLRDEHTKVLVRRLVRDYVAEHKGRILLALLGMAIVAGTTAAFTQLIKPVVNRSEARRVGKECVSTCKSRRSPCP